MTGHDKRDTGPEAKPEFEIQRYSFRDKLRDILEGVSEEQFEILSGYFENRFKFELDEDKTLAREWNEYEGEVITGDASDEVQDLFESIPALKELFEDVRKTILVGASDEYVGNNVIGESWIAYAHYLVSNKNYNLTALKNQDEIIGAISTRSWKSQYAESKSWGVLAEENAWIIEAYREQGYSSALIDQLAVDFENLDVRIVEVDKDDDRAQAFAHRCGYGFSESSFYIQPKLTASTKKDNNDFFNFGVHISPLIMDSLIEDGLLVIDENSFKLRGKMLASLIESYARTFPPFIDGKLVLQTDGGSGKQLDVLLENSLDQIRKTEWVEFKN